MGQAGLNYPFYSCSRLLWVEQISVTLAEELERNEHWGVVGEVGSLGNCRGEPFLLLYIYFKAQVGNQAHVCWEVYKHVINRPIASPKEFED